MVVCDFSPHFLFHSLFFLLLPESLLAMIQWPEAVLFEVLLIIRILPAPTDCDVRGKKVVHRRMY